MKHASRVPVRPLLLVLLAAALGSCDQKPPAPPPPAPVPVTVATVEKRDVAVEVRGVGHVEALETVTIKARVGGEIREVAFREG